MTACPAATPVTTPSATVAMALLELVHVRVLSVALSGWTLAVSVTVLPSSTSAVAPSSIDMPVTGITFVVTVTAQVAVLPPSAVLTVMVAVPALTAVTLPVLSTVAMAVAELVQLTDLLAASDGVTVARSWSLVPSTRERVAGLTLTPVTCTSCSSFLHAETASRQHRAAKRAFFIRLRFNVLRKVMEKALQYQYPKTRFKDLIV